MSPVPRLKRVQPIGIAIALYETWRRLPPHHRERLMGMARRHGPRVAASLVRRRLRVKP
jgi:hypothetical protein